MNLNLAGVIYRTLDVGAQGVVVPHVDTAEQAREVVDAGKFAPIGHRGNYGGRQSFGVEDYLTTANDETLLVVLIEDVVAIENLDEILTVDHIDCFFVAPGDLSQSMGLPGGMNNPGGAAGGGRRGGADHRGGPGRGQPGDDRDGGGDDREGRAAAADELGPVGGRGRAHVPEQGRRRVGAHGAGA